MYYAAIVRKFAHERNEGGGGYHGAEKHISQRQIYRPEFRHQRLKGVDGTTFLSCTTQSILAKASY
jgi:hypothetical protein